MSDDGWRWVQQSELDKLQRKANDLDTVLQCAEDNYEGPLKALLCDLGIMDQYCHRCGCSPCQHDG